MFQRDFKMFGWFNKARLREQQKLLYQIQRACAGLKGWAEGSQNADEISLAQEYEQTIKDIKERCQDNLASADDADELLRINKDLRRHYDNTSGAMTGKSFDDVYQPVGGWKAYYKRQEE